MKVALWIIAICEVIRAAQNMIQLMHIKKDEARKDGFYGEFMAHLKESDREFVKELLNEFEAQEAKDE